MYKELLKKFDLSIGELFLYRNNAYMVLDDGIYKKVSENEWDIDAQLMVDMLVGNITKIKSWHPVSGIDYYIFNTAYNKVEKLGWLNSKLDNWRLENGLICKTEEEAWEMGKKIISEGVK